MRAVLLLIVVAGCGSEEEWIVRPPGHGTGGNSTPVDAAPVADGRDGGDGLTGLICIVDDLRRPAVCPLVPAASGVLVRRAGDATGATSGADGRFTLAVTDATVILDVATGSATLQPSIVPVDNDGGVVHAAVPTAAAWNVTVESLDVAVGAGTGAIALYTDDAAGAPAAGVLYTLPPGVLVGPFYDGASATTWTTAGGTGPLGATLLVDLDPGTYTLDGNQGARVVSLEVPVLAGAVTFVRARLPP